MAQASCPCVDRASRLVSAAHFHRARCPVYPQAGRLCYAAAQSRVTERFIFVLVSLFGALGLILAAVGLYGLLSLQVARREREFGIRSALGATAKHIMRLVARQGGVLLGLGFVAGAAVTFGLVRLVQSQWAEMPAPNFVALLGAAGVLGIAVVFACWLPARRAARVDPVVALRAE
ncbi:MAG: FtsX-like permease family protein [Verrucomicrobiaceae bacterium]|nr:FtsX-like permease family protein [Verrucomicrobiaceae bacterium]